jgi:hypothetical protein
LFSVAGTVLLSTGGSIVGRFLAWDPKVRTVTAVPKLSAIRREYKNRDDAIRVEYESGAYSYQQIAKEFEVHFTTVGRIVLDQGSGLVLHQWAVLL